MMCRAKCISDETVKCNSNSYERNDTKISYFFIHLLPVEQKAKQKLRQKVFNRGLDIEI